MADPITPEMTPVIADEAPTSALLTDYDLRLGIVYLRLLDAEAEHADWREVAAHVLRRDPVAEPLRTRRCWESHLERARWMTRSGHDQLLASTRPH